MAESADSAQPFATNPAAACSQVVRVTAVGATGARLRAGVGFLVGVVIVFASAEKRLDLLRGAGWWQWRWRRIRRRRVPG